MAIKKIIKTLLKRNGFELNRYPNQDLKRRMSLLKNFKINVVFDIGANSGQYASTLFDLKFDGKVISFEPLNSAYQELLKVSGKKENWSAENMAIGNMDGEIEINISENSWSSSILNMLDKHLINSPESRYINKERVIIHKLDTIYPNYVKEGDIIFLKIDTQGYEKMVLDGADSFLKMVNGIQLEMSLVPLYSNEVLFQEMILYLQSKGFSLYSLEPGFSSENTGQLLQVDGIFFRDKI
jgi:FkbM family methyltransferase